MHKIAQIIHFSGFHLAIAAAFAICERCDFDKDSALALPPLRPPSRPSATAAGFLSGLIGLRATCPIAWTDGNDCPVERATILAAIWFMSVLERLGMVQLCAKPGKIQA